MRFAQRVRALLRSANDGGDRKVVVELRRQLAGKPRDTTGRVDAFGWDLEFVDAPSMLSSLEVLVVDGWNDFVATTCRPLILDCGANIGISVLNYKRRHPSARIIAFEPDPQIAPVLRRNLERNGAADTEVVEAAAWISDGEARWFSEGADGSRVVLDADASPATCSVRTVDLRRYLDTRVDLLKIDIEGGEYELLTHIVPSLVVVDQLIVECHVMSGDAARFGALLSNLAVAEFNLAINCLGPRRDLVHQPPTTPFGFDQYFVVAGWRTRKNSQCATPG